MVTTTTPIIYTNCFFKRTATGVFPKAVPSKNLQKSQNLPILQNLQNLPILQNLQKLPKLPKLKMKSCISTNTLRTPRRVLTLHKII
jgi:hypothetical protein